MSGASVDPQNDLDARAASGDPGNDTEAGGASGRAHGAPPTVEGGPAGHPTDTAILRVELQDRLEELERRDRKLALTIPTVAAIAAPLTAGSLDPVRLLLTFTATALILTIAARLGGAWGGERETVRKRLAALEADR